MSDLISREATKMIITMKPYDWSNITERREMLNEIDNLPSVELERKTGYWIDTDNYYQRWKCSECGCHTRDAKPNYCPNCGAKMEMRNDE